MTPTEEHLRLQLSEAEETIKELRCQIAGMRLLTREIDVAMHGEEHAAKQASLCDLVPLAGVLRDRTERAEESLKGAKAHIALIEATLSQLSGVEERAHRAEEKLAVAIDWIKGLTTYGDIGLESDKKAILAALKKGGE